MSAPVHRIDRFTVPSAARAAFLAQIAKSERVLNTQPGLVRHVLLEAPADGASLAFATCAEWRDRASYDDAVAAMQTWHASTGFEARALLEREGITMAITVYDRVEPSEEADRSA